MSCSLCRLPFTPSNHSVAPRWPPPGVLTDKQLFYMKHAFGMGQYVIGLAVDLVNMDNNNFIINNSSMVVNIVWETGGKTFIVFHPHCATILRHHLGFMDNSAQNIIELALLEHIIGPTMDGVNAGRLKDINYEGILGNVPVDIESLWSKEDGHLPEFNWLEWKRRDLDWTAARPDVFPRFRPQVSPSRISSLEPLPESTDDIVTNLPVDILHALLPYLEPKTYVNLFSTCRTLRHHALTTFQPQARTQVLRLGWALPTEVEYAGFVKRNLPSPATTSSTSTSRTAPTGPAKGKQNESKGAASPEQSASADAADYSLLSMAHAVHSPVDGDWYLYLSQIHRSKGMRARRWVWALAEEFTCVYRVKRAAGPYEDVVADDGKRTKSRAWTEFANMVKQQLDMRAMITSPVGINGRAMRW